MGTRYAENVARILSYSGKKYKLTNFRTLRRRGQTFTVKKTIPKGEGGNEEKLRVNLARAKSTVFQLAMCNPWDYFVTLTLDEAKRDRKDLQSFQKDLTQLLRDHRKKYNCNVKYLLIPEKHKDGCWHMHGFLYGLPKEEVREFSLSDFLPNRIRSRMRKGKKVYTWTSYARKFGFSDLERLENSEAAGRYMTKYITKEAMQTITELNSHIFYASKGLKRAEVVYDGVLEKQIENPDMVTDWVIVKWYSSYDEVLKTVMPDTYAELRHRNVLYEQKQKERKLMKELLDNEDFPF